MLYLIKIYRTNFSHPILYYYVGERIGIGKWLIFIMKNEEMPFLESGKK